VPGQQEEILSGLIPEDLFQFRWLEAISLSPDGERVAYTVRRPGNRIERHRRIIAWSDHCLGQLA